jgi:hypothetical protein
VVTLLWGIFFYNGARAILLGQFSILVALALFLALWAIEEGYDNWAGLFLALTTIKPQMVFLIVIFLLAWALFQKRWNIPLAFIISLAVLIFSSMLLVPTWPFDFVRNAIAYSDYVAFGTPLENLLLYLLPGDIAAPLTVVLSLLFFLLLLPGWWLALRHRAGAYTWAVQSTLIISSLITFRSATTNQIILYLPLFFFFRRLQLARRPSIFIFIVEIGLLLLMWSVFAITLVGNWENVMMHGLLPALMLLLYILDWRGLWQTAFNHPGQTQMTTIPQTLQPKQTT